MRVALVAREVYPLGGGGIAQYVGSAAALLSEIAEVTVFTTSVFRDTYERLRAENDPRLPGESVRFVFVEEPTAEEAAPWRHVMHCYSARVYERLQEVYSAGGPDLIEFPDFLGEGFVTIQAAEALDRFLERTSLCVRIHTTAELCEILDGFYKRDLGTQVLHAMERYSLAHAHHILWQGGDILETYRRFYGADQLAPATMIRYPYRGGILPDGADRSYEPAQPLRILYAGRLERRKGVHDLVRAASGLERGDFRLTLVGRDTQTAPLGVSMRGYLELAIAEDDRIELLEPVDRRNLVELIRSHDLTVVPSRWECWPYAVLEPLRLNRPVLATPVGGMVEMVRSGVSGWLTTGTSAEALEEGLVTALEARAELQTMVREQAPARRGVELTEDQPMRDAYRAIFGFGKRGLVRRPTATSSPPLVSAVVPYYRAAAYVRDAIDSLLAQTYPHLEIVLVNDGSFEEPDWVVAELAAQHPVIVVTQMNAGLGAARNLGIRQSRGRYVFPLDSDNIAEPEFVARCVEVLERRPEAAYVTSWSRYIEDDGSLRNGPDLGYEPLGNFAECNSEENVAGDAAAVLRRRIFDAGFWYSEELTSFEDWHFYRELRRAGHLGIVIPQRMMRYRVRGDSMQALIAQPRRERLLGEIDALIRENGMQWTSSSD